MGRKPNISARNWDYVWGSNSRGFSGEGGEEWGFSSMTDDSQEVSRGQAIRYGSVSTMKGYSGKRKMLPVKRDNREVETERVTYSMHMGVVSMGGGAGSSTHEKKLI